MAEVDPGSAHGAEHFRSNEPELAPEQHYFHIKSRIVLLQTNQLIAPDDQLTVCYRVKLGQDTDLAGEPLRENGVAYEFSRWYAEEGRVEPIVAKMGLVLLRCDFGYRLFVAQLNEHDDSSTNCTEYKLLNNGSVSKHTTGYRLHYSNEGLVVACVDKQNEEYWPEPWWEADPEMLSTYNQVLKEFQGELRSALPGNRVRL